MANTAFLNKMMLTQSHVYVCTSQEITKQLLLRTHAFLYRSDQKKSKITIIANQTMPAALQDKRYRQKHCKQWQNRQHSQILNGKVEPSFDRCWRLVKTVTEASCLHGPFIRYNCISCSIIHSIYIAPLEDNSSEALPVQPRRKRSFQSYTPSDRKHSALSKKSSIHVAVDDELQSSLDAFRR